MKINFILKFFLKTNLSKFRFSFLIPLIGVFVGSFAIFLTFSIMNGLQTEIHDKLSSFNYNHAIHKKYLDDDYDFTFDNSGQHKIVYLNNYDNDILAELYIYSDINDYTSKIQPYIIDNSKDIAEGLLIGHELAISLGVSVGDTLQINFPADINLISKNIPSLFLPISLIYSYNLFDYDSRYIIASKILIDGGLLNVKNDFYYTDKLFLHEKTQQSDDDLLISAIQLEKKLYISLSFILLMIALIMIFNVMTMVMLDKAKQLYYLNIIGLTNQRIFNLMLLFNIFISLLFTISGYILSQLIVQAYSKYGMFNFIFYGLPFDIKPIDGFNYQVFIIYIIINTLIIGFSSFPYILRRKIN